MPVTFHRSRARTLAPILHCGIRSPAKHIVPLPAGDLWYAGWVLTVNNDGSCNIAYCDGDSERSERPCTAHSFNTDTIRTCLYWTLFIITNLLLLLPLGQFNQIVIQSINRTSRRHADPHTDTNARVLDVAAACTPNICASAPCITRFVRQVAPWVGVWDWCETGTADWSVISYWLNLAPRPQPHRNPASPVCACSRLNFIILSLWRPYLGKMFRFWQTARGVGAIWRVYLDEPMVEGAIDLRIASWLIQSNSRFFAASGVVFCQKVEMNPYCFAGIEFVPAVVTNIGDDYAEVTFLDKPAGKASHDYRAWACVRAYLAAPTHPFISTFTGLRCKQLAQDHRSCSDMPCSLSILPGALYNCVMISWWPGKYCADLITTNRSALTITYIHTAQHHAVPKRVELHHIRCPANAIAVRVRVEVQISIECLGDGEWGYCVMQSSKKFKSECVRSWT